MNHINTYKIFDALNSRGSKTIKESEFDKILKTQCKNWTKAKTSIYRGQKDLGDYIYIDPKGKYRNSIEDTNLHIELMDNLTSWKDYPKYSESIIGVTDFKAAKRYSDKVYEVIPFDNTKIGICPESTIWESFGSDNNWGEYIYLVRDFLGSIGIDTENWTDEFGKTIEDKLKSVKSFDKKNDSIYIFMDEIRSNFKKNGDINGHDCFKYIEYLFNPTNRGFNLKNYISNFEASTGVQIWTNGPVLLINTNLV